MAKNEIQHKESCILACTAADRPYHDAILQTLVVQKGGKQCSCTALDLCMQTNYLLDDETRQIVYDLFFKMF